MFLKTLLVGSVAALSLWMGTAAASSKIIYIPLDNRPVNLEYTTDTAKSAGFPLTVPPREYLSGAKTTGNNEKLWEWFEKEAPHADAAIIATDSLNYGGLVASRKHHHLEKYLRRQVFRLDTLKKNNPGLKIYAFSTIMRTPQQSVATVEPAYYETYGPQIFRLSQLMDKEDMDGLSAEENMEKNRLTLSIPSEYLQDWRNRRLVNLQVNRRLIRMAQRDNFHFLALGKDDNAPYSRTHMEARQLEALGRGMSKKQFQIIPGVDQLGLLLVTRAINELKGEKPEIYPIFAPGVGGSTVPLYTDETAATSVKNQVIAVGGRIANSEDKADLILAVNTPDNGVTLDSTDNENAPYSNKANKQFARQIARLETEKPVALADIAYANGADNGFILALSMNKALLPLTAYSGWNTADNSIGFALSQGILAKYMSDADRDRLLRVRLLDDWIYQSNVRYRVSLEMDRYNWKLKYDMGKYYNRILGRTNRLFKQYVADEPDIRNVKYTLEFPWNRMFEVDVRVR
ncbi:MAG: DUF4127 family protein [Acidaminococcus sp.]|jgi:hypothetical protein|nr:DUF4127 family protein [Acidaminococcus sp.]MCI2100005.1 DUF4127 family protein [Acidaminococcus sp.]MCI2114315.1 DUF4127 family protein [Acidaminococcus sp.]MCI2116924.1 DUF4127 family protein [Acidaminococcus sp.]